MGLGSLSVTFSDMSPCWAADLSRGVPGQQMGSASVPFRREYPATATHCLFLAVWVQHTRSRLGCLAQLQHLYWCGRPLFFSMQSSEAALQRNLSFRWSLFLLLILPLQASIQLCFWAPSFCVCWWGDFGCLMVGPLQAVPENSYLTPSQLLLG